MTDTNWQNDFNDQEAKDRLARRILGVSKTATIVEIKQAFHLLAMEKHPDKAPLDKDRIREFQNIVNAYTYLVGRGGANPDLMDPGQPPEDQKINDFHMDNSWGYYQIWRQQFFHAHEPGDAQTARDSRDEPHS